jgi:hypothetical protein
MFTIMNNPIVWWPVVINMPIDGGETSKHEVSLQFEILTEDEYDEIALKGEKAILKHGNILMILIKSPLNLPKSIWICY